MTDKETQEVEQVEEPKPNGIDAIVRTENRVAPSREPVEVEVLPEVTPSTETVEYEKSATDFTTGDQRKTQVTLYGLGKDGKPVEVKESEPHFAKKVVNTQGERVITSYELAVYNGTLYNPAGQHSNRNKNLQPMLSFKKTNEAAFNDYLKYIDKRIDSYYWRANREVLNG